MARKYILLPRYVCTAQGKIQSFSSQNCKNNFNSISICSHFYPFSKHCPNTISDQQVPLSLSFAEISHHLKAFPRSVTDSYNMCLGWPGLRSSDWQETTSLVCLSDWCVWLKNILPGIFLSCFVIFFLICPVFPFHFRFLQRFKYNLVGPKFPKMEVLAFCSPNLHDSHVEEIGTGILWLAQTV